MNATLNATEKGDSKWTFWAGARGRAAVQPPVTGAWSKWELGWTQGGSGVLIQPYTSPTTKNAPQGRA